jgi:hypothetical protein
MVVQLTKGDTGVGSVVKRTRRLVAWSASDAEPVGSSGVWTRCGLGSEAAGRREAHMAARRTRTVAVEVPPGAFVAVPRLIDDPTGDDGNEELCWRGPTGGGQLWSARCEEKQRELHGVD